MDVNKKTAVAVLVKVVAAQVAVIVHLQIKTAYQDFGPQLNPVSQRRLASKATKPGLKSKAPVIQEILHGG